MTSILLSEILALLMVIMNGSFEWKNEAVSLSCTS